MAIAAGACLVLVGREGVPLRWSGDGRGRYDMEAAPESGLMKMSSERANVLPGTVYRARATLARGVGEMVRA
jgi:hypothetical protein